MTESKSLLHVCAPAPFGGLEGVVAALTAGLARRGHRVAVAAVLERSAQVPAVLARAADAGVELAPVRVPARAYSAERRAVGRLASDLGARVLHTHGHRSDVVCGPLAARVGAARVSTAHGFIGGGPRNRFYEWLQVRAWRRCDAVVAVSEALAGTLRISGVPHVRTIQNGDPLAVPALYTRHARAALGVDAESFHVGWVGRLSPEKGPDVFLSALARLAGEASIIGTLVGDGPMRAELEALADRLELGDRVRFAGSVPDAARLFQGFDALALSSRSEGTPVTILEAVQAGTPIVAARVGGVPDAVGPDGALFVEPDDPDALAAALLEVRSDPVGACVRVERARTHRRAAGDWIAAYEETYAAADPRAHRGRTAAPR